MKRPLMFLAFFTMLTLSHGAEQPPYDVKDPAVSENFREIYRDVDSLQKETSVLTTNTSGQILLGQGTGAVPIWGFRGIGRISVVAGTTTGSTTSSSFAAMTSSATITPSSTASRILVIANGRLHNSAVQTDSCYATLWNVTGDYNMAGSNGRAEIGFSGFLDASAMATPATLLHMDSPATTSPVTYQVRLRNSAGGITCSWGGSNSEPAMILMEVLTPP